MQFFSTLLLLLSVLGLLSPQHFVHNHPPSLTIVNSSHRLRHQLPLSRKKSSFVQYFNPYSFRWQVVKYFEPNAASGMRK